MSEIPFKLLTVTWSGDRAHFSLLRTSLQHSAFSSVLHDVVVQAEDLQLFQEFGQHPSVALHSTKDVLPSDVEAKRQKARRWQKRCGRRGTTLAGSFARRIGWPHWVRYTGWHTQQLSKLAHVAASDVDTVVILDSDVVATSLAATTDFCSPGKLVCYEKWQDVNSIAGKVRNWQETAHQLFGQTPPNGGQLDCYYDTPFVMHAPTVRAMMAFLEERYQKPWWRVLLALPPRRWSEFGCYKQYVRGFVDPEDVQWRSTDIMGYLFDASDRDQLLAQFDLSIREGACHYVTIHSQSSGRHDWGAESYSGLICKRLTQGQK